MDRSLLLLVLALVACKSKSEQADQRPALSTPTPGEIGARSGSGSGGPMVAKPVVPSDTGAIQRAKTEPRHEAESSADPSPATPTPTKPDDTVKPAGIAAGSDAPPAGGFDAQLAKVPSGPAGRDAGARLPPGSVGFTKIQSAALTTRFVADASRKIETAYRAGLERCFRVHLATHPNASGTATVSLAFSSTGMASPGVTAFADDVAACLTTLTAQWRLPAPDARPMGDTPMRMTVELTFTPG